MMNEGTIALMQFKVIEYLKEHPNATDREMREALKNVDSKSRRRELQILGVVKATGKRSCSLSGRVATTWALTDMVKWDIVANRAKAKRVKTKPCPWCNGTGRLVCGQVKFPKEPEP